MPPLRRSSGLSLPVLGNLSSLLALHSLQLRMPKRANVIFGELSESENALSGSFTWVHDAPGWHAARVPRCIDARSARDRQPAHWAIGGNMVEYRPGTIYLTAAAAPSGLAARPFAGLAATLIGWALGYCGPRDRQTDMQRDAARALGVADVR